MGKKIELEKEFIDVETSFLELKNSNASDSEKIDSMNYFIKLQFDDLHNFDYKLSLKDDIDDNTYNNIVSEYGDNSSETLAIEIKDDKGDRDANTLFVDDSNGYVRYVDNKYNFIKSEILFKMLMHIRLCF